MKNQYYLPTWIGLIVFFLGLKLPSSIAQNIRWPEGKMMALSLTFDDARESHPKVGLPLFQELDAQVTFYVIPAAVRDQLEGWKALVEDGHELGNHTLVHPCSGNFPWARDKALENYNLPAMRQELIAANQQIEALTGVKPKSFAYPCGQSYVGRGQDTRSFVPLIAELFETGRDWLNEAANSPIFAELSQLQGISMDGKNFKEDIKPILKRAAINGDWVVLAGHEIGEEGFQTTKVGMLRELMAYVSDPQYGIWMAPVGEIATYVKAQRAVIRKSLSEDLTLAATFDHGLDADFAKGNSSLFTAAAYNELGTQEEGLHFPAAEISEQKGVHGHALAFPAKAKPVAYYRAAQNVDYQAENWNGTISLWLSLDPDEELAPGYTDPIQITDVGYNDAALWVDFSDKNPRSFRMGVYGDLAVWNPKNIAPDKNPAFTERLLPATDLPFGKGIWTHVVISFEGLNTDQGKAAFYINGKQQGERQITEPFSWDLEKAKVFLGLNFIGLLDEVALFNRSLSPQEVQMLYHLPGGLSSLLPDRKASK
ncbi:MAG: polysaccharide deacetylase family protein [Saprospiraceae bacterium]|nr:polysaccharide deacetylase family protein [Saprospiraceae bacterium]